MLRPSKSEVEAVAELLSAGSDSPESMAEEVIRLVERLRHEREQWVTIIDLGSGIYVGRGPYATKHMAVKAAPKDPWISHFDRPWSVVSVYGPDHLHPRAKESEAEWAQRVIPEGHWSKVRDWIEQHPGETPGWKPVSRRR